MTFNQFKLYCIVLVAKNEGKMASEVFSQNKDNVVLSMEELSFYSRSNYINLQISSLSILKFQLGCMLIWAGDADGGDWEEFHEQTFEDLV